MKTQIVIPGICLYVSLGFLLLICSCNLSNKNDSERIFEVDFSDLNNNGSYQDIESPVPIYVAVSAMISPQETYSYYKELFNYISKKTKRPVKFKQRKTYKEVNVLLENNQVDMAFICSGAYIIIAEKDVIEILAVPVCSGKPYYQAYIIVHKSSSVNTFKDFRGKSFAFTDPMSNTGRLFAYKKVAELNASVDDFFSKTVYTYAHDISIQLVSMKIVEGATIDGLILDYLKEKSPEKVENIRVIEKSEHYGIPPIVISKSINKKVKEQLKELLFDMHNDSTGRTILNKLMIDKFIQGNDSDYNSIRRVYKETY